MAYVVARPDGAWEIRESRSTAMGPRSSTLASFRTMTPKIVERARARSTKSLRAADLHRAAARAGAPVTGDDADRASGELLGELAAGRGPRPALRRLLLDALAPASSPGLRPQPATLSANARAAARWIAATPQQRGETLHDLLLLADRLPPSRAKVARRFPRVRSASR